MGDTTPSALPPSNPPPASTPPTNPSPAPAGSVRPKPTPLSCTRAITATPTLTLTALTATDTVWEDTTEDTTVTHMPMANPLPVSMPPTNLSPVPKPYLL